MCCVAPVSPICTLGNTPLLCRTHDIVPAASHQRTRMSMLAPAPAAAAPLPIHVPLVPFMSSIHRTIPLPCSIDARVRTSTARIRCQNGRSCSGSRDTASPSLPREPLLPTTCRFTHAQLANPPPRRRNIALAAPGARASRSIIRRARKFLAALRRVRIPTSPTPPIAPLMSCPRSLSGLPAAPSLESRSLAGACESYLALLSYPSSSLNPHCCV